VPQNKAISVGCLSLWNQEIKQQLSMVSTCLLLSDYENDRYKSPGKRLPFVVLLKGEALELDTYQPRDILLVSSNVQYGTQTNGAPERALCELLRYHPLSGYVHHECHTFEQYGSVEPPTRAVE